MKRLFTLLLTLALLLGSAAMAEFDYTGLWTLTSEEVAGVFLNAADRGLNDSVLLKEDGSCVLTMHGETQNGTWVALRTGITTTDATGDVNSYTLVDGKLVLEVGVVKMTFARAAEKTNYLGSWALTGAEAANVPMDPVQLGLEVSLSIYEDGTCDMVLVSPYKKDEGIWTEIEGGIVITITDGTGTSFTFTEEDGALVTEVNGGTLIFTPVDSETEAEEDAVPLAGLTMADFNGEWAFVDVEYMGQVIDAELLGMSIDLHIQDGKGHVEMTTEEGTEIRDGGCMIDEIKTVGTVLFFFYTDPATGETTGAGMMLMLYSDGRLAWCSSDDENNDIFYNFEKVANVPE